MVIINGEEKDVAGVTLANYLLENEYHVLRIAVERNDEIVPKATYEEVTLNDGDVIEIVNFVGGGA